MLKYFYRLRRRRGVVLFAVIAMMTLLITMATVAYFTTRASYKTVISNYDFSQMYISTTSVADMLIDSVMEETSKPAADVTAGITNKTNYFTDLRNKLQAIVEGASKGTIKPGNAAATLVGVSGNIDWDDRDDIETILAEGAADPVEAGVLDAIKVNVKLDTISEYEPDGKTKVPSGTKNYYFTLETVGFYRYNTITIQDTIYEQYGETKKGNAPAFDTFFTATGQELTSTGKQEPGGNRIVHINSDTISDNAYFQNKFTIFGIAGNARTDTFKGGIRTTGSFYGAKLVCDIPAPTSESRHDWIIGGDLVLGHANASIDLNGNDLYVKGDLYLLNDQELKAGNIFVEGNVYYSCKPTITITGGTKPKYGDDESAVEKDCGMFVKGSVIGIDKNFLSKNGTYQEGKEALVAEANKLGGSYSLDTLTISDELNILNSMSNSGVWVDSNNNPANFNGKLYIDEGTLGTRVNGSAILNGISSGEEFVWDKLQGTICVQKEGTTSYEKEVKTMKVSDVLDKAEGKNLQTYPYANYSATQTTVDKVLTLDFTGCYATTEQVFTLGSVGGETATLRYNDNGDATIELPYVDGGYRLEYKVPDSSITTTEKEVVVKEKQKIGGDYWTAETGYVAAIYSEEVKETHVYKSMNLPFDGNCNVNIVIRTSDDTESVDKADGTTVSGVPKAMPIVLAANCAEYVKDSTTEKLDEDDLNCFSWIGGTDKQWTTGTGTVNVVLVSENADISSVTKSLNNFENGGTAAAVAGSDRAKGFVIFEMGNYDTSSKTYKEYDPFKSGSFETVSYFGSGNEKIGTLDQIHDTNNVVALDDTNPKGFLSGDDISAPYDNKVILVSNKNMHKTAYTARMGGTLFGYIYAPNGNFKAPAGINTSVPVFGGMIVSDYNVLQGDYLYGQPDPNLMLQLGSALGSKNSTPIGSGTSVKEWNRTEITNYKG